MHEEAVLVRARGRAALVEIVDVGDGRAVWGALADARVRRIVDEADVAEPRQRDRVRKVKASVSDFAPGGG